MEQTLTLDSLLPSERVWPAKTTLRAAAGSSPIHAVIDAVHKYLSFTH